MYNYALLTIPHDLYDLKTNEKYLELQKSESKLESKSEETTLSEYVRDIFNYIYDIFTKNITFENLGKLYDSYSNMLHPRPGRGRTVYPFDTNNYESFMLLIKNIRVNIHNAYCYASSILPVNITRVYSSFMSSPDRWAGVKDITCGFPGDISELRLIIENIICKYPGYLIERIKNLIIECGSLKIVITFILFIPIMKISAKYLTLYTKGERKTLLDYVKNHKSRANLKTFYGNTIEGIEAKVNITKVKSDLNKADKRVAEARKEFNKINKEYLIKKSLFKYRYGITT